MKVIGCYDVPLVYFSNNTLFTVFMIGLCTEKKLNYKESEGVIYVYKSIKKIITSFKINHNV